MHHSIGEMIFWSINLLSSMRGIGFAFGPPEYTLDVSRPRQRPIRFLAGALRRIAVAHFISTTMLLVVVARQSLRIAFLQAFLPLPVAWLHLLANVASYALHSFSHLNHFSSIPFEDLTLTPRNEQNVGSWIQSLGQHEHRRRIHLHRFPHDNSNPPPDPPHFFSPPSTSVQLTGISRIVRFTLLAR